MTVDTETKIAAKPAAIELKSGGRGYHAFRFAPPMHPPVQSKARANLVMFPDWSGATTPSARRLAAEYAQTCGCELVLTDVYGAGFAPRSFDQVNAIIQDTMDDPSAMREVLLGLLEEMTPHWSTPNLPVIAVGFCFGGTLAFETARAGGALAAALSAHGMPATTRPLRPGGRAQCQAEFIMCQGARDPFITATDLHAFEQEMETAGQTWTLVHFSGAKHSFTRADLGPGNFAMGYNRRADVDTRLICRNLVERLGA